MIYDLEKYNEIFKVFGIYQFYKIIETEPLVYSLIDSKGDPIDEQDGNIGWHRCLDHCPGSEEDVYLSINEMTLHTVLRINQYHLITYGSNIFAEGSDKLYLFQIFFSDSHGAGKPVTVIGGANPICPFCSAKVEATERHGSCILVLNTFCRKCEAKVTRILPAGYNPEYVPLSKRSSGDASS